MALNPKHTCPPKLPFTLSLFIFLMLSIAGYAQEDQIESSNKSYIGMKIPTTTGDPRVPIKKEQYYLGLYMGGMRSPYLRNSLSMLRRTVEIDSTGNYINFVEKIGEFDYRLPRYMNLFDYVEARRKSYPHETLVQNTLSRLGESGTGGRGGAIRIDIPVEIKSKAFQAIFGGSKVGLDVSGQINIKGGFRNEKRSQVRTAMNRGSNNSFKMEQTQRFNVSGHVGEKVKIKVDQDSERAFDFENRIGLTYEGYEDEIIKHIEAGNISINLPGTRFVTASMRSSGLFGIKTDAQLGPLSLTTVVSQEKGQKKKLSLTGGASDEKKEIDISRYKRGSYFFIDEYYRTQYINRTDYGEFLVDPGRGIAHIDVYVSEANYQQKYPDSQRGWAWVPDESRKNEQIVMEGDTSQVDPEHYRGYFRRLEKDEYYIQDQLGYIRLNQQLMDGSVLAVAYEDSSGRIRGDIEYDPSKDKTLQVRLLKTKDPRPSDTTWPLEWKNVYSLGGRNIPQDGFECRIYYQPPSGDPQETVKDKDGNKMTWLTAFGLDRFNLSGEPKPDGIIDDNPNIINFARGELFFPHLRPFDPQDKKLRNLLYSENKKDNKLAPAIYDTTVQSVINEQTDFYIEVKSETKSSEYHLGMNVIENSEEVTLNGRTLTRGVDYTIDYFTGTLRLLNEQATAANANLDITYESNQLFQIDKKTVMGARAEYGLWDNSFIGATFMYLNEKTLDQKIRVGKGPMQNMIWDVNTLLEVKPFFLTKMANWIPFVDTRSPTSLKFEGEIAQIIPNPNTRNNEDTGDNSGVAYIDDFEASKRVTPIQIIRSGWNYCSPPPRKFDYGAPDLSSRARLNFWNPYDQYPIKYIWPNKDLNANVAQTTNIIKLEFQAPDSLANFADAWNGIQKALSSGYNNQTEAKYLEIWVLNSPDLDANLHIELGQISEDIIPNMKLDTEDKLNNGIRNGLLDDDEDVGLDGMADDDPRAIAAGGDFWDLNGNGKKDYGEPYSFDNWRYDPQGKDRTGTPTMANGTENNEKDSRGRFPDTEDMNGNGDVDLRNDYFEYTINLNHNSDDYKNYVVGESIDEKTGDDYGWRLYQIPLNAPKPTMQIQGSPDLSLVEYMRVWIDGIQDTKPHQIWIAEMNLVGSDWKEQGIAPPEQPDNYMAKDDSTITISVVNTHDNPSYRPPPGVEGEVDRITRVQAKEQSLVLKVNSLLPGYNGKVQKTFFDAQDYINYNRMKMFVYGRDETGIHINRDSSKVEFYLRFGADENNYYEIRKPVYQGWTKNSIDVDLIELSQVKLTVQPEIDSVGTKIFTKHKGQGERWIIHGEPALRNVKMLEAGVLNKHKNMPFNGEIYMNELRLSDVKKEKGIAMRARVDFSWADLVRFNGEINRKDAEFHNVSERFGTGDNQFSGNFSTSISVDKFLPSKLGVSIPVSLNYSRSESTPKYIPGEDVEVTEDLPDSTLEKIRTFNEKKGMSVSFGINSQSQNFFVKHLLSRLKASYSRNEGNGSNSRTEYQHNKTESGNVSWGISFGRDNYIFPFGWLENTTFLNKLSDMKLFYTPQSFNTQMSGTRSKNESMTRSGVYNENSAFKINRGASLNMNIFEKLSFDISRDYTNDLRDMPSDSLWDEFKSLRFGLLTNVNQNISTKYNPKFFSWLTTNLSYSISFKYGYNRQQRVAAHSTSQNRSLMANGSVNLSTFAKSIYRPGRQGGRPQSRRPRGGDEDSDKGGGFSILGTLVKAFDVFDPISVNYSSRNNRTVFGIAGMPVTAYQFGLSGDPGVPFEELEEGAGTTSNRGSSSENETFGVKSGLKISRNVTLSFGYDKNFSFNKSTQTTGQRSESWLVWGEDFSQPFPTWSLRVNGIEKLPFIKEYVQRFTVEHTRSGRANETFNMENGKEVITKKDKDTQFRPMIGMNIQMKNGISVSVRYNKSSKETLTLTSGKARTIRDSEDLSVTANYSKKGNFRLPLPFMGSRRLKNNIDFSLTFTLGNSVTYQDRGQGAEVSAETGKWLLKPSVNYSFSSRVTGGAYFEIGKNHNKMIGDTSFKELGIDVSIAIRGN